MVDVMKKMEQKEWECDDYLILKELEERIR